MNEAGQRWTEAYRPLLGLRLQQIVFCPLAGADTPDVIRDLAKPTIGFSGSVLLGFEDDRAHFLSWMQVERGDFGLMPHHSLDDRWRRFALDQILMSQEDPWGRLAGATLELVEIYSVEGFGSWPEVAAAHHFKNGSEAAVFWASTATGAVAGSGDDLLVSIDVRPDTYQPMQLTETIQ